jgi:hypothetical protein
MYIDNVRRRQGQGRQGFYLGRGLTKETGNYKTTAIYEKNRRFQADNWFLE